MPCCCAASGLSSVEHASCYAVAVVVQAHVSACTVVCAYFAHAACSTMLCFLQAAGTKLSSAIETQLCYEVKTFLLAGHEVSAAMLMWSVTQLSRHPQHWEKGCEALQQCRKSSRELQHCSSRNSRKSRSELQHAMCAVGWRCVSSPAVPDSSRTRCMALDSRNC
jgi:hypothetical protein